MSKIHRLSVRRSAHSCTIGSQSEPVHVMPASCKRSPCDNLVQPRTALSQLGAGSGVERREAVADHFGSGETHENRGPDLPTSLDATPSRSQASMAGVMPSPLGSGWACRAAAKGLTTCCRLTQSVAAALDGVCSIRVRGTGRLRTRTGGG